MQILPGLRSEKLEFFPSAPLAQREWLSQQYSGFELSGYLQLLAETDGVGEVFAENGKRFVHNMLLLSCAEALETSQQEFEGKALVIGNAGVDGILFVLQPACSVVYAYYPISSEFTAVADSVAEFLEKWGANEVRL
jgi:hypothetical protein